MDVPRALHGGGGRPVVLMAMANDVALQQTVPAFVASMQAVHVEEGEGGGGGSSGASTTLDRHLVLMCSSETAVELCRGLELGDR
eukprot:358897-Chlamydomonas_euryale.AAC.12